MRFKGHNFSPSNKLVFRNAIPGDTTVDGDAVQSNYVMWVDVASVGIDPHEQPEAFWEAVRKTAPAVPISGHSRTNMAYGVDRIVKRRNYQYAEPLVVWNKGRQEYYSGEYVCVTPIYMAYDGCAYKTTMRTAATAEDYRAFREAKKAAA